MKEITADANAIAFCGLYCGACGKYLKDKCPGCQGNDKASWCKVRTCCMEKEIRSCADCDEFEDLSQCAKLDNFMARMFGFFFRSDRMASLALLRQKGYDDYAAHMTSIKRQSLPR